MLLGKGDGTFLPASGFPAPAWRSLAVGDFNGDGRLDLALPGYVLLQISAVSLSSTSLTLAGQLVGTSSAQQTVTLSNTGGLALNIDSLVVTGTNAADFGATHDCGSRLPPGASCTISITFTPSQIGPRTASLAITDNAAGSPQSVAVNGTGVVQGPNATLSAASFTFTTQPLTTTSPAQFLSLSNYGSLPLSITSISASGDFVEANTCGSSLATATTCTISTSFAPTQIGMRTGMLSLTNNAPGSPQSLSLTGTGTSVQLDKPSLYFSCLGIAGKCSPPPQAVTLTNTSGTVLSISGITISPPFTQTNDCGVSVGPGSSCTITVTLTPSGRGRYTGAVSIYDDGGGSPQQVTLSGYRRKGPSLSAVSRSALAATRSVTVPGPTGSSPVGTRVMDLVEWTRDDPFLGNGTKRELAVRLWYPASGLEGCHAAEYSSPAVWKYFSQLVAIPLPEVTTNSCLAAPIAGGAHPVVVFTHGYTGTFTDYTFIFEDLASRGYVVASVDHTYEATAVEFPGGRFMRSVVGSHADNTWRLDEQALSFAVAARLRDLKFVVNELDRLNTQPGSPFTGKLDTARVAIAGHSLGGYTALIAIEQEPRYRAAIVIDGAGEDTLPKTTETPVLYLAAGREQWNDGECRLWDQLRGRRLAVNLQGAEHLTPSDAIWLAQGAVKTGFMGPEKTIAAVRSYIAAFLDATLRSRPSDSLLSGPSLEYPDAAVTTQDESLCTDALDGSRR